MAETDWVKAGSVGESCACAVVAPADGVAGSVAKAEKSEADALVYMDEEKSGHRASDAGAEFRISPEPQAGSVNIINIMHNSSAVSFKACFSIIISSFAGY